MTFQARVIKLCLLVTMEWSQSIGEKCSEKIPHLPDRMGYCCQRNCTLHSSDK